MFQIDRQEVVKPEPLRVSLTKDRDIVLGVFSVREDVVNLVEVVTLEDILRGEPKRPTD